MYFTLLYLRSNDPWDYESSEYEHRKYQATLNALPRAHFSRTLEVGCSIGVFTSMLAERTDELLAIDVAPAAVTRARRRLAGHKGVRVERAALPEWRPAARFDLIVCSEILYYLDRDAMLASFQRLEQSLAPGGSLVAVHRRGKGRSSPLHGDLVHDLLIKNTSARHAYSERHNRFLLDRFDA
jgi:trans-aconitate methyltransferase